MFWELADQAILFGRNKFTEEIKTAYQSIDFGTTQQGAEMKIGHRYVFLGIEPPHTKGFVVGEKLILKIFH